MICIINNYVYYYYPINIILFVLFFVATYTDPCKRNDKDFSGCLKKTLQYLIPKFSKG